MTAVLKDGAARVKVLHVNKIAKKTDEKERTKKFELCITGSN